MIMIQYLEVIVVLKTLKHYQLPIIIIQTHLFNNKLHKKYSNHLRKYSKLLLKAQTLKILQSSTKIPNIWQVLLMD